MVSKSVQLETDLYRAIDGFVIARIEDMLGTDDPGISLSAAKEALMKQLRILCNEACSYKPEPVLGPIYPIHGGNRDDGFFGSPGITQPIGPIVAQSALVTIEDNFHMKDLFAKDLGIADF